MTALAMDVRELSFEEIEMVNGGDARSFAESVAAGLLVAAIVANPPAALAVAGAIAVGAVLFGATAAH